MKLQLKLIFVLFVVVGCSVPERWVGHIDLQSKLLPLGSYTVKKGDTLYGIAWAHNLDYKALARWNQIKAPDYLIYAGQNLQLTGAPAVASEARKTATPKTTAKPPSVRRWHWPLASFVLDPVPNSKAVLIKGQRGELVHAAADGTIVYSNFNLKHYRGLVIIKHANDLFSAYGYNDTLLVKAGDSVRAGQTIARLPKEADVKLYFELRQSNRSVNALNYFPQLKVSN